MLKNEITYLRALEPDDIDYLYKWENDPNIWEVSITNTPYSKYTLAKYIAETASLDIYEAKQLRLVIVETKTEIPSGLIDIFDFDPANMRAGVGIAINEAKQRGKKLADNALKLLIEYCFDVLHLHQLYCNIAVTNKPSINLFEKNGFIKCGHLKHWHLNRNGWSDEYILQLIKN